ncbi:MAG: hypothetical protein NC191_08410 [Muribaculaceae bacterium]|nr:hypothetical protein [Muribaculaceae bacterium]
MKKILLLSVILTLGASSVYAFEYLGPINEGNRNIAPIKQHQFEKQETLDFVNNPNEYKIKREQKDAYLDYKEGKTTEIPEFMKPKINNSQQQATPSMEFTKGEDGQIKIQGIR